MSARIKALVRSVTLVVAASAAVAAAQDDTGPWLAPAEAKAVKNPVAATPEGLAAGQHLFRLNCMGCHGQKGDGNGAAAVALEKKPANFTDAKMMSAITDGELFWMLTTGRPPMPPWTKLSETERWQLVNYIRTFSKAK